MDINVYLPDEVGNRAKEAKLPLSRMLRDAVEEELAHRKAIKDALSDGIEEHELEVWSKDEGAFYTGVITGKQLVSVEDRHGDPTEVYLTDDERVLVYVGGEESAVHELQYPESELPGWLPDDPATLVEAMAALGLKARVRL